MNYAESRESSWMELVRAIVDKDIGAVRKKIAQDTDLVRNAAGSGGQDVSATEIFIEDIQHRLYTGDTALHIAAASYQEEITVALIAHGADVRARNRRGAEPLHYAADGVPGSSHWNPAAQAETIARLIDAGADANALDKNGTSPLHRAIRNRCAAAVGALLKGGADPDAANRSGSTSFELATQATGRGGSGSTAARTQQKEILRLLKAYAGE